ncbi:SusE domain-containing protein [Flavobacterium sp. MR2016-29]|uniref:SusE domain-containing protein n=1 Tax=Flavobacterium sp. MR2016-29 TaxID=2783795 RepID=UPI001889DFC9|nr:SusE domain-containing protein [Flavobacterium sp. MR2016-29]MBF4492264.1 SusE domain-containing protein [Flavobacterium sp. MR2016-29]
MKKYISTLFAFGTLLFLGASCENDAELTYLKEVNFPADIKIAPSSKIVLLEDKADDNAITISWEAVTFPIEAPVTYAVQFDVPADITGSSAWLKATRFEVGQDVLSKSFSVRDLNKIATDLGLQPNSAGKLIVRVEAAMDRKVFSNNVELTVTPFEKSIVFGEIYMPGAYQGEWDVNSASVLTAIEKGVYQGYVTVLPGYGPVFKVNTARNWAEFYGAGTGEGTIQKMSDADLKLPGTGSYQVKVNLNTLKWSATAYAWGIVGTAQSGGWDKSTPMNYDHQTKTWKITADLVPGALKFRLNDNWSVNYGPKDATTNTINRDDQGAYTITEAGTYEVTFTIVETDPATAGYPATATCTIIKK